MLWRELVQYRTIIMEFDARYTWSAIQLYDIKFRSKMAMSCSLKFGHIDSDILLLSLTPDTLKDNSKTCFRCKSPLHIAKDCPFQEESTMETTSSETSRFKSSQLPPRFRFKSNTRQTETCNNFNKGNCVFGEKCFRVHKCWNCGGKYPFSSCSSCHKSNNKPNNTSTSAMQSNQSLNPYATPFNYSFPPPQTNMGNVYGTSSK